MAGSRTPAFTRSAVGLSFLADLLPPEGKAAAMATAVLLLWPVSAFGSEKELLELVQHLQKRLDATDAEVRSLRSELKIYKGKSAKTDKVLQEVRTRKPAESRTAAAQGAASATAPATTPPLPFFISTARGLKIESGDRTSSFKIGGRLYFDGGGSSMPEKGYSSLGNIRQARLEVEGRVFSYWEYKFQYEFAAGNTATVGALGGVRDAFVAYTYFNPIILQVGSMFEPFGLEASKSTNYTDFMEKALPTEVFGPGHHVGAAVLAVGDRWSAKAGVFSTSPLDNSLTPAPGTQVPYWVPSKAGWAATGGSQYFDVSGRVAAAPIKEDDRLLHFGLSGRYHRPNDSTGGNDNRVMLLGANTYMESNILKENLLGAPDLSCGLVGVLGNPAVAGKCVRDVLTWNAEISAVYGPASVQGEYFSAHYSRDAGSVLEASTLGYYAPGGASLDFNGYYVYGAYYLTGESRAAAYKVKALNPSNFGQIKINNPISKGGLGAWEIAARFSTLNLNNGPYTGANFANMVALAPNMATKAYVANSSVLGGREEDLTVGLNWYPDTGYRVIANWTRVMLLSAPWNRAYLNNAHPNTFLVRTQVDW
jgi:phosphate-selective porin OprO and OprP